MTVKSTNFLDITSATLVNLSSIGTGEVVCANVVDHLCIPYQNSAKWGRLKSFRKYRRFCKTEFYHGRGWSNNNHIRTKRNSLLVQYIQIRVKMLYQTCSKTCRPSRAKKRIQCETQVFTQQNLQENLQHGREYGSQERYCCHLKTNYRAFSPICRKVLKMIFKEIPLAADRLTLQQPTTQAGPRN